MLYVPNIDQNLLSVGQLVAKGFKVVFEDSCSLMKDASGQDILKAEKFCSVSVGGEANYFSS